MAKLNFSSCFVLCVTCSFKQACTYSYVCTYRAAVEVLFDEKVIGQGLLLSFLGYKWINSTTNLYLCIFLDDVFSSVLLKSKQHLASNVSLYQTVDNKDYFSELKVSVHMCLFINAFVLFVYVHSQVIYLCGKQQNYVNILK